ncbi:hypothetical protein AAMO2058_000748800 [Amorphochlora amoebiformis]
MADWSKNSTIANTLAKARASLNTQRRPRLPSQGSNQASLLEPSRPYTPLVPRDSYVYDDDSKGDWPVFYTESTLLSERKSNSARTPRKEKNRGTNVPFRRPASCNQSTRSPPSRMREVGRSGETFTELMGKFSSNLRELRGRSPQSKSLSPSELCDLALSLLCKAKAGSETLMACSGIFKLPIKYSGREDSKYYKLMLRCLKRIFDHSTRQDYDKALRSNSLIPLTIKHLKRILKNPKLAPTKHISYLLGTFRNISNKEENQRLLVRCEGVQVLAWLLDESKLDSLSLSSEKSKIGLISEVTTILRNLSIVRSHSQDFVKHGVISLLGQQLLRYPSSEKVVFGVCRILSKLTYFPACRSQISENPKHLRAVYGILDKYPTNLMLCIRACFILGNLTVSNAKNRAIVMYDYESKDCVLMRCLGSMASQDRILSEQMEKLKRLGNEKGGDLIRMKARIEEIENYLVKTVRLLANVCIHPDIGKKLCQDPHVLSLVDLLERKDVETREELVLNVISAITNLSYYQVKESILPRVSNRILGCLMPLFFSTNHEMLHEAVRVLGNFSRMAGFRRLMSSCRVDETMNVLLDHPDEAVIFSTAGVILNISTDLEARRGLYSNNCEGLRKITECLGRFGDSRPEIGIIICKILLNLSSGINTSDTRGGGGGAHELKDIRPTDLSKIWLPPEVMKHIEKWCEDWLERCDVEKGSPTVKAFGDLCARVLETIDKFSCA